MKFYMVLRDNVPLDEPLATEIGAKAFIRICKRIDKVCKRKYIYEIEEVESNIK